MPDSSSDFVVQGVGVGATGTPSPLTVTSSDFTSDAPVIARTFLRTRDKSRMPQKLKLEDDVRDRLINKLHRDITNWKNSRGNIEEDLARYNDLVEGITPPKSFPWKNSANFHIPLTLIHVKGAHNIVSSTMLESDPVIRFRSVQRSQEMEQYSADIERFTQQKLFVEDGWRDKYSDVIWLAAQDGTCATQDGWGVRRFKMRDIRLFTDVDSFITAFPDPKKSGISEKEYESIITEIRNTGNIEFEVEQIKVVQAPVIDIVPLKDFVVVPYNVDSEDDARGQGRRFYQSLNSIRTKALLDFYDMDAIGGVTAEDRSTTDVVTQAQYSAEGISHSPEDDRDNIETYDLCYDFDYDNDGIDEKLIITFLYNQRKLVRVEKYTRWGDSTPYVVHRIIKRPKRLLGKGIPYLLYDLQVEINTLHNQRIDSHSISIVPMYIIKPGTTINGQPIDVNDPRNTIRPGGILFCDQPDNIKQLGSVDRDFSQSFRDEQWLFSISERLTGVSATMLGGNTPTDPRAAASKHIAEVSQAMRQVDGYIRTLTPSLVKMVKNWLMLYYQYGPEKIKYYFKSPESDKVQEQTIERFKLNPENTLIEISRTSVANNPEFKAQKAIMNYQLIRNDPLVAKFPDRAMELLRQTLLDINFVAIDKIIPNAEQMQQLQQESQIATAANMAGMIDGAQGGGNGKPKIPGQQTRPPGMPGGDLNATQPVARG